MKAYLCLGANLSQPVEHIQIAMKLLEADPRICVLRRSKLIQTKPYGKKDQPDFWNQVIEIETDYTPPNLLRKLLGSETKLGRTRGEKWGPRLIDIDILLYEDQILNTEDLILPHPDFHHRKFALQLLSELVPDMIHPVLLKSISTLLSELDEEEEKT